MIYLGSQRVITNSFSNHKTAEDYAGAHLSEVKINGTGVVTKVTIVLNHMKIVLIIMIF